MKMKSRCKKLLTSLELNICLKEIQIILSFSNKVIKELEIQLIIKVQKEFKIQLTMAQTSQINLSSPLKERLLINLHKNIAQSMQLIDQFKEQYFIKMIKVCNIQKVCNLKNLPWKIKAFKMQHLFLAKTLCINLKCEVSLTKNQQFREMMKEYKNLQFKRNLKESKTIKYLKTKVWWQSMKQAQKETRKVFLWVLAQPKSLKKATKIKAFKRPRHRKTILFNSKIRCVMMNTMNKLKSTIS